MNAAAEISVLSATLTVTLLICGAAITLIGTPASSNRTILECRSAYIVASGSAPMVVTIALT